MQRVKDLGLEQVSAEVLPCYPNGSLLALPPPAPGMSLVDRYRVASTFLQSAAADRFIHAFVRARMSLPDAHPARFDVVLERDVAYRDSGSAAHTLDVYMPTRAPKPLPTVMYVHGGGFAMLSKDTHRAFAMSYARRGYLVFLINYRLGPHHVFPAPFEDASAALLWAHANAARYGGDPSRLVIAGESAGGNLVTALALATSMRRPEPYAQRLFDAKVALRAVVATYGFLDLEAVIRYRKHPRLAPMLKDLALCAAASYVGLDVRAGCAASPLASPLVLLERCAELDRPLPPFFADVGTRDVLLNDSRRLKMAVERLGSSCELHVVPGAIHGYDALPWRRASREKWRRVHAFLAPHVLAATDA
jgi:acetyl esterase